MTTVRLIIESTDFDPLAEIIRLENSVDYESISNDTMVFVTERFRIRTTSSQNEMVV